MSEQVTVQSKSEEMWATVELMGHAQTAGRVSKPSEWGGLLRVDVPTEEGYRTEFYGMAAIYAIKFVSEDIARAYAAPVRQIVAYDTPIVTREAHQSVVRSLEMCNSQLSNQINHLERRLTAVNALPESGDDEHGNF